MNISEKRYWVILLSIFGIFAILLWFWWIPYNIIEYNLAVNLFTGSIFMIFTILFLSWLLSVRERAEWRLVRDEVFFNIKLELGTLFDEISEFMQGGLELKYSLLVEKNSEKRKDLISSGLNTLKESKIDSESLVVRSFFKDQRALESFLDIEDHLGDVQNKYSRHLSADITVSLIRIQRAILALRELSRMYRKFQELSNEPSTPTLKAFLPLISRELDSERLKLLQAPLLSLIKELCLLYDMKQFKFNYPVDA